MTTFLSRIPFDSSLFVKLPKLNDYWSTSESSDSSDSQYQDTSDQSSQSDSSVSQSPQSATSDVEADQATGDKAGIADLIAEYGSSAATSWLEFARYKIWRPTVPIPHSSFPPVQGYLRSDPYVFAWGNPVVSDPAALEATCAAFIDWAKSQNLRAIWLCVDDQMEKVLGGQGSKFAWSVLSCIVEDYLDPRSVVELAHSSGGGSEVKDFKKNLRRAQRANVRVREVQPDQWTDSMKRQVEQGIVDWKKNKTGIQIASTSFMPWLDFEHRRYWVAEKDSDIVAILVLTSIRHKEYQIKNAVSFPNAPRGTSEEIIYRVMLDLQDEGENGLTWSVDSDLSDSSPSSDSSSAKSLPTSGTRQSGVAVTFGLTASDTLTAVDNLSGWKIAWLSTTYNSVISLTGLTRRGDFRNKFHTTRIPMYIGYSAPEGFGLDGVNKLIKSLRQ
ncbi:hypothetical protein BGW80DRAFT_1437127 [Lactifluus volemus]|nr:hypothetical protein BGW80DRAFT_1437127 [Lactifluus volemus]